MINGKVAYLEKISSRIKMDSVNVGKEIDESIPPSVFLGSWKYPKVYAGPMITLLLGDTTTMDMPESWIPQENNFIEKLQEISLANSSIRSEVEFIKKPKSAPFSDEPAPHGPRALIQKLDIDNSKWDHELEKVFYDSNFKGFDAVLDIDSKEIVFSSIQKAFSIGAMGAGKRRKLLPTKWSITICDITICNRLLKNVNYNDILGVHRVYKFSSLSNYYGILRLPTEGQYEWIESFSHVLGSEELIFSECERNTVKKRLFKSEWLLLYMRNGSA